MWSRVETALRRAGRRTMGLHPAAERAMTDLWGRYARAYLAYVAARNAVLRPYGTGIDPFQVIRVDPDDVVHRTRPFENPKFKYAGRVSGGDWDRVDRPFEETDVYRAYEAHFSEDVPWTETAFFDRIVERIENGDRMWGCRNREEFEERCRLMDRLYENIRDHGYKSQRELANGAAPDPIDKRRISLVDRLIHDEVAVSIGRDGELLFSDGRNRLAIAKVLDLDSLPAWVLIRHADWQQLRRELATGERRFDDLPSDLRSHPDLQGFRDDGP